MHNINLDLLEKSDSKEKNLIQCLSACELGSELLVVKVNAGQSAKKRLANLGIVPGVKIVKTKSAPFHGPIKVKVKGSFLILGRGLASKIVVDCANSCNN